MKNKIYGYARISMAQQSIERQIRNIKEVYPDAIIVQETWTGTDIAKRKELQKISEEVKAGDTIVFDSISRMSRDAEAGYKLYQIWFEKGVNLVFLKESYINTEVYRQALSSKEDIKSDDKDINDTILEGVRKYLMRLAEKQIKIAFEQAEKEVQDLRQRTREGIETARLAGKQIGQVEGTKLTTKKSIQAKEVILKHSQDFNGTLSDADTQKLAGISRNTYYKYKKELREEVQA